MSNGYKYHKTPEWFRDEKYSGLSNLSASDFLEMISLRLELQNVARLNDDSVFNQFMPFFDKPLSSSQLLQYRLEPFSPKALFDGEFFYPSGGSFTAFPSVKLAEKDAEQVRVGTLWGSKNNGSLNGSLKPLFVDISAPDQLLREAFDSWLKSVRKEFSQEIPNMPKQSFESERKRIVEQKLLQYIDLKIWFTLKRISFNDSEIAYILFPYEKDSEHIRKTVRPNAEKLMSFYFRMWLEHQIGNKID